MGICCPIKQHCEKCSCNLLGDYNLVCVCVRLCLCGNWDNGDGKVLNMQIYNILFISLIQFNLTKHIYSDDAFNRRCQFRIRRKASQRTVVCLSR